MPPRRCRLAKLHALPPRAKQALSKVQGALYFSVHSPGEFEKRLVQDFDYAVT